MRVSQTHKVQAHNAIRVQAARRVMGPHGTGRGEPGPDQ
jgi:hypothetical protein